MKIIISIVLILLSVNYVSEQDPSAIDDNHLLINEIIDTLILHDNTYEDELISNTKENEDNYCILIDTVSIRKMGLDEEEYCMKSNSQFTSCFGVDTNYKLIVKTLYSPLPNFRVDLQKLKTNINCKLLAKHKLKADTNNRIFATIAFSIPVIDKVNGRAAVYATTKKSSLNTQGIIFFLKLMEGKWKIVRNAVLWTS